MQQPEGQIHPFSNLCKLQFNLVAIWESCENCNDEKKCKEICQIVTESRTMKKSHVNRLLSFIVLDRFFYLKSTRL